jgi:hypothetical protein
MIFYVDVEGTGTLDSLSISLYDDKGNDLVATKKIVLATLGGYDRHRVSFNTLVGNCSIRISDVYSSQYTINSIIIGYQPWDEGRVR